MSELVTQTSINLAAELVEKVVIEGDLSTLTPAERVNYYRAVCDSVGLNPLTKPFEYLRLNGKLRLYALKTCTDQLRNIHGISIELEKPIVEDDLVIVTAVAKDRSGRVDSDTGAVPINGLRGEAKANAILKAITKAKRRVTLSMVGLGMLDESEVESIPGAEVVAGGEVVDAEFAPAETARRLGGQRLGDDEAPVDLDVIAVQGEELVTGPQLRALHTIATKLGFGADNRDRFRAFVSAVVSRQLTSSKDLTKAEATMLLDHGVDELAAMLDSWNAEQQMAAEGAGA